jgi:hypothetical protein
MGKIFAEKGLHFFWPRAILYLVAADGGANEIRTLKMRYGEKARR